jgi:hypothetical protein
VRFFYLHGFASSPSSKKGVFFRQHFGEALECLDLRVPTLERLAVSSMVDTTMKALNGVEASEGAVLIGSSLGGLTAAYAAEMDAATRAPRVRGVILLAPAFAMASRWRKRIGPEALAEWKKTGWITLTDPEGPPRLHYGFLDDADRVEAGGVSLSVPALVIHGRRDEVVPVESSRAWVKTHKRTSLVEVDDTHPLYNTLDQVVRESDSFLHKNNLR